MARGAAKAKRWKPVTRSQAVLLVAGALLLIRPIEVALVGFINPPRTRPMVFHQVGGLFSRAPQAALRYEWAGLRQIPEMFGGLPRGASAS